MSPGTSFWGTERSRESIRLCRVILRFGSATPQPEGGRGRSSRLWYMPAPSSSFPDHQGNGSRNQTASSRPAGTISVPSRTPPLTRRGRRCDGGVGIACEGNWFSGDNGPQYLAGKLTTDIVRTEAPRFRLSICDGSIRQLGGLHFYRRHPVTGSIACRL